MRDVLVRAESVDRWDDGVVAAARLAAAMHGALTAVHVVPIGIPPLSPYDPGLLAATAAMEVSRQMREAEEHAAEFAAWAASMGAKDPVWLTAAGDAAQALTHVAGWHDLLVARLDREDDDPWANPGGVGRMILSTRLPTLVLPAGASTDCTWETIAVAWNGSPESARALHSALPVLARAERVVILDGGTRDAPVMMPALDLAHWCTRHLPHADVRPLGHMGDGGESTGAALLAAAREAGADLLAMGAYGHTRLSEWVLGGVTRHVLCNTRIPLLMRH